MVDAIEELNLQYWAHQSRLESAWSAQCDIVDSLQDTGPGKYCPALGRVVGFYRAALGGSLQKADFFHLAVYGRSIAQYADKPWPIEISISLQGFVPTHRLFIRSLAMEPGDIAAKYLVGPACGGFLKGKAG